MVDEKDVPVEESVKMRVVMDYDAMREHGRFDPMKVENELQRVYDHCKVALRDDGWIYSVANDGDPNSHIGATVWILEDQEWFLPFVKIWNHRRYGIYNGNSEWTWSDDDYAAESRRANKIARWKM